MIHVTATLEVQEDHIVLEVTDDGAGVPDDIRSSLFEPFVSQGKQKGSGLGLTLAHCIAAEHGGYLVLVSSRPGETIFRMCDCARVGGGGICLSRDFNTRGGQ